MTRLNIVVFLGIVLGSLALTPIASKAAPMNYAGTWSPTKAYAVGQVVNYQSNLWMSLIKKNKNISPGEGVAWQIVGAGTPGPKGERGDIGPRGEQGLIGPQGPGGAVKAYDAKDQFIGYEIGWPYYFIIPTLNKVTSIAPKSRDAADYNPYEATITFDLTSRLREDWPVYFFISDNCSGTGVYNNPSLDITNQLGWFNDKIGYLKETVRYKGSDLSSTLITDARDCTDKAYYQNEPLIKEICTAKPSYNAGTTTQVADSSICSKKGFSTPCWVCGTRYVERPTGDYYVGYEFIEENLPFNLPVALPLRYETPQ